MAARFCLGCLLIVLGAAPAAAQDQSDPDPPLSAATEPSGQSDNEQPLSEIEALRQEIQALREENKKEIEALREEHQQKLDAFAEENELRHMEMEMELLSGLDEEIEEKFTIYGFLDFVFMWTWFREDSIINGLAWDSLTFALPHANLYFRSQLTSDLFVLMELRYSFLPHGNEEEFEIGGIPYRRTDSEVEMPLPHEKFRLGGVAIERAHLTYQPLDYLGFTAGYFLTPYGIWNEDHASPILIPIRYPYMQTKGIVPMAQLGVQIFGRLQPLKRHYLDYAITISNGRGPLDTVHDLDNNKAIGLKLKLSHEGQYVSAAWGVYGYYGEYRDRKKRIVSFSPRFVVEQETTEHYREYVGSADLLIEAFGFRLQGEYVRRLTQYIERPLRAMEYGVGYQPDYVIWAWYGIIYWDLPLRDLLGTVRLGPFYELEYSHSDVTVPGMKSTTQTWGINLRPSPYVTIKLEAAYLRSTDIEELRETNRDFFEALFIGSQLAVSF